MSRSLVAELAGRVQRMEGKVPGAVRAWPVLPSLGGLLPQGLQGGGCYAVRGSLGLATALLAGASTAGEWCGVVGVPEFGAEAAAALGVDLSRLLLVPDPRQEWLTVVATLVEALPVVLTRPPLRIPAKDVARLEARLRRQGAVLVVVVEGSSSWPRATADLTVGPSRWSGLGDGRGTLTERDLTVQVTDRGGRCREVRLHQRQGAYIEATAEAGSLQAVG